MGSCRRREAFGSHDIERRKSGEASIYKVTSSAHATRVLSLAWQVLHDKMIFWLHVTLQLQPAQMELVLLTAADDPVDDAHSNPNILQKRFTVLVTWHVIHQMQQSFTL